MARRGRVAAGTRKAFDESKHKRAAGGRFGSKPATGAAPAQRQRGAVGAAHAIFEKLAGKPRSEVLAAAVAAGINRNTASTQLGAWQRARAARELAAAGGDTSKAARQAAAARALGVKPSTKGAAAPKPTPTPKPPASAVERARKEADSTLVNGNAPSSYKLKPGERPVAAVHRIATLMRGRPRAEVIATLSAAGVNRSTASVQYSAWARAQGAKPAPAPAPAPAPKPTPTPAPVSAPALSPRDMRQRENERIRIEARARVAARRERLAAANPSTTPVAAPKLPVVPSKSVRRHPITDSTINKPKEGTPERDFHDKLLKAASVFPNARFTANYGDNGKIKSFHVKGGLLGDHDSEINISRNFGSKKVDHTYFSVGKNERGNGAAKTFLAESVAEYKAAGYTHVKVHANIDVGGYAWLRYGFKPNADSTGESRLHNAVMAKLDFDEGIRKALNPEQIAEVTRLSQAGKHDVIAAMTTPITLPNGTSVPLGRRLYLYTDWYGELPLKDGAAYDTFKRYAGGKS